MVDTADVDQGLLTKIKALMAAVSKAGGNPVITSGYRSPAEQARLYNSGNGGVPVAKPGQSKHNLMPAEAVDVSGDTNTMNLLHKLAPDFGLSNPVANDPVHFENASSSSGVQTVSSVQPTGLLSGSEDFLKSLVKLSTWIRAFEIIFGVLLIGLGIGVVGYKNLA